MQPDHRPVEDYRHLSGTVALSQVAVHTRELREAGVRAVKLFSYVESKTPDAREALEPNNLLVMAVQAIRVAVEDMVISPRCAAAPGRTTVNACCSACMVALTPTPPAI